MADDQSYAVFLYPQALAPIEPTLKPYLHLGESGRHLVCSRVDASGSLFEMTLAGRDAQGNAVELEVMVQHAAVMLVLSLRADRGIGFAADAPAPGAPG